MIPYQRIALYILFDSIEADLILHIRNSIVSENFLTSDEREKCLARLAKKSDSTQTQSEDIELITELDLGDKFDVLLRNGDSLGELIQYFRSRKANFSKIISVRNDIMHGRSLTIDQQVIALAFAQDLLNSPAIWPRLSKTYREYSDNPSAFIERSISFLDEVNPVTCLHNLPVPDFDDTGWLPRSALEQDLKKKILGRHPVISVLGDGGNGKTALALQVLHDLVRTNDHDFEAIIWTTAKATALTVYGIKEIEDATIDALDILDAAAILEPTGENPKERIETFLRNNKILLAIDNYETIVGDDIQKLAEDVPGDSKILFTSRHPIGGDITVFVGELSPDDAMRYFHRLIHVYGLRSLYKTNDQNDFSRWLEGLSYKPLSIKWLVLGIKSGLNPELIAANPDNVLKFCLENVINKLNNEAQAVIYVLATIPVPLSPSLIKEISNISSMQVVDGIAELNRFNLIEPKVMDDGSQVFAVRPFAKTYIHRLVGNKKDVSDEIVRRYQSIESEFQEERYEGQKNSYSLKSYVCNNRSQMLLARNLKRAVDYAYDQKFEDAEIILEECKRLEPGYFENQKAESLIALAQNDLTRAIEAVKVAISLDGSQAKLYHLLGSHYMRLNEPALAADCFEQAIRILPDFYPLRDASRNEMMRYDFPKAEEYLLRARDFARPGSKNSVLFTDIEIQLHTRKIDWLVRRGDFPTALDQVDALRSLLEALDDSHFDQKMVDHVMKVTPSIAELRRSYVDSLGPLSFLEYIENRFLNFGIRGSDEIVDPDSSIGAHIGTLKKIGLKHDYGFLESDTAPDSFVHIRSVGYGLWSYMISHGSVTFDVEQQSDGKYRAVNVRANFNS